DRPGEFSMLVGTAIAKERLLPTFDIVILQLGHGRFPWSAFLPFAIGRMLARPMGADELELERQAGLRVSVLIVAVVGLVVYGTIAPATGVMPFGPVFALAAMAGIALRDFERGASGSRAVAM